MKKLVYITPSPSTVRAFLAEGIEYLSDEYDVSVICSPGEEVPMLQAKGIRIKTISMQRRIAPFSIVFVFVGRVVHDKGIDKLVPAFLTLVRQGANARLLIIGKEEFKLDPISPETKSLIDQSPEVMAVGMQSNIPEWLEVADVFVLPSHREGCNCSILEGAAMGLPSISSNILGCNEVVQNGKTGTLISSGNIQELSEAMFKLYAHKQLRTTMGHQAREYAHTNYDRQDVWRELHSFYRKISSTSQEIIQ